MSALTNPRLHVTSKLMQDYRIAQPVTGENAISTVLDSNGNLMVFSIGSEGNVYCIFPDVGSSTGWSQKNLNFLADKTDPKAKIVAAGKDAGGQTTVFVCDIENRMHMCRLVYGSQGIIGGAESNVIVPSPWNDIPDKSLDPNTTFSIRQIKLGYDKDGNLLLTVRKRFTYKGRGNNPRSSDNLYWIDYAGPDTPWQEISHPADGSGPVPFTTLSDYRIVTQPPAGVPVGSNGVSIYMAGNCLSDPADPNSLHANNLRMVAWPDRGGANAETSLYYLPQEQHDNTFWNISPVPDTPAGETGGIFVIQQPSSVEASDHTLVYCPVPRKANSKVVPVGRTEKFQSFWASRDANGLAEAFALTTSNTLFHVRQDPNNAASASAGWQDGIEIMTNPQLTQISLTRHPNGVSHVFAVTADHTLNHVWQDKDSTDWHKTEIELQTTGRKQVEQFSSYWTELTIYDSETAPSPNKQVKIFSNNEVFLNINGALVVVDRDTPWAGTSNATGKVVVSAKTNSLGTHALTVWTEFMPAGDRVAIDASGSIQMRIKNLQQGTADTDAETLLNAKVTDDQGNQTYLLKDEQGFRSQEVADMLTEAIKLAMSLAPKQPAAPTETARYLHPKTNLQVARYAPGADGADPNLINTAEVAEQHWQVNCSSGKPVFRTLSKDEAAELIAGGQAARSDSTVRGILPIDLDWGDVVEAAEEEVANVTSEVNEIVVSTVIDPVTQLVSAINAKIEMIIDKIEYVWNGTIEFVEQAYDIVVMIFKMVKVTFDDLFRWLGFIFVWPDILRTKDAVKHCANESFELLEGVLRYLESNAETFFGTLRDDGNRALSSLMSNATGGESLLAFQSGGEQQAPSGADESATGNVFWSGFTNNLGISTAPKISGLVESPPLQDLINLLKTQATEFQDQCEFSEAMTRFQEAATRLQTDPDYALKQTVEGLLSTLRGLAGLGIDLIRRIVSALVEACAALVAAIKNVLNAQWEIPFVTDLYSFVTQGSPLTVLDLSSLIMAIPTTALYKITYQQAPFPNQDVVNRFRSTATAQAILNAAGLNPASNSPAPRSNDGERLPQDVREYMAFVAYLNLFAYLIYAEATAGADALAFSTEDATANVIENGCSIVAITTGGTILLVSNPWFLDFGPPEFTTPTRANMAVWLFLWLGFFSDSAIYIFTLTRAGEKFVGKKASLFGNTGVVINIVLGLTYFTVFAVLADIQVSNNDVSAMGTTANMLCATPLVFKFLRFSSFANNPKCKGALVIIDQLSNATAGILYCADTLQKLRNSAR